MQWSEINTFKQNSILHSCCTKLNEVKVKSLKKNPFTFKARNFDPDKSLAMHTFRISFRPSTLSFYIFVVH